jgi:exodeoxyribonuclease VII large subunit
VPLPVAPLHLGLVTAGGSAAEADVLETLRESGLAWRVLHVDARVQGVGAAEEVAAGLLTAASAGVEVIALVRGGGARTDLATFDHELVARTIAGLSVPVVTGIGHETDQSLADLVAHRAERTPTACAAALVAHVLAARGRAEAVWATIRARADGALATASADAAHRARRAAHATTTVLAIEERRLDHARHLVRRGGPTTLARAAGRLERAAGAVDATSRAHLRTHQHRLDVAAATLAAAAPRSLRHAERSLDGFAGRVDANDPRRALARGWSITRTRTGTVVRTTNDVEPGDTVVTTVADGAITSVVAPPAPDPPPSRTETDPDAR